MASHKNQHFVPRCYLKPFTAGGQGVAINLFNIDRQRVIEQAPVKSQCSGDYFYGKDLMLERDLQQIEGANAETLSQVLRDGYVLTDQARHFLRAFWLLQFSRTDAASRRTAEMSNGLAAHVGAPADYRMSIREAVQLAMTLLGEMLPVIADLKVCLLRNRTALPFVASDDPAIMSNKWHLSDERTRNRAIGLGKAGALFFLPLSPNVMCVIYDGDVYSIPHAAGWARVDRVDDVRALNEHQFLNCRANLYFRDWPGRQYLAEEFARNAPRRPQQRYRIHVAVFDREENGYERYRVVDREEEETTHGNTLIHSESISPRPSLWPANIAWRSPGCIYTNGTGLGYVRRAKAVEYGFVGFRKLRLH